MSYSAMAWARRQTTGNTNRKAVLMELSARCHEDHGYACWPSQATLARELEMGERTVRRCLKELEESGLIERERRTRDNGSRASDRIIVKCDDYLLESNRPDRPVASDLPANDDTLPARAAALERKSKASTKQVDVVDDRISGYFDELAERGVPRHRIRGMRARWLDSPMGNPMESVAAEDRADVLAETLSRLLIEEDVPSVPFIESGIVKTLDQRRQARQQAQSFGGVIRSGR